MKQFTTITAIKLFLMLTFVVGFISCSLEKEENLTGAWKFVSGKYTFPDTSMTLEANPNLKSFKVFSKTHFSNLTQDTTQEIFIAHGGKYLLNGNEYTEYFEISQNTNMIGSSATFKYTIEDNQLKISSDNLSEVWERIE